MNTVHFRESIITLPRPFGTYMSNYPKFTHLNLRLPLSTFIHLEMFLKTGDWSSLLKRMMQCCELERRFESFKREV